LANVRFGALSGLKSGIAPRPKSANNGSGMTRMGYRRFEKSAHQLACNVAIALARAQMDWRPTGSVMWFLLALGS
jgi:hypothetical protein